MSFIVDDSKELYEIWRIQDFSDLDKEDITYKKITGMPEETLEETQKLADKYIDYIEILIGVHGERFMVAPYYDKLYIIKNGDDIKTYEGDEYYDMRYLPGRRKERIRLKNNKNKEKYIMICCFISLILFMWIIF